MKRARETSEIATDGKYKIQFDDRLMERSFGNFGITGYSLAGIFALYAGYKTNFLRALRPLPVHFGIPKSLATKRSDSEYQKIP